MARRRFGPLVVTVVAGALSLLARLYVVQIREHDVWAGQAAALVRSGQQVPYRRGDILDRERRVLVHDVGSYRVVLAYREFRREHPLGQVAHALSALELRSVPFSEAWLRLEELALALVRLSPERLDAFARGEALEAGPLSAPACDDPSAEERAGRRSDLAFYVGRLLGLERGELSELARAVRRGQREPSYLELALSVRRGDRATDAAALRAEILGRLRESRAALEQLSELLALEERDRPSRERPLARLIERLEGWRAEVEDGAAGDLFEQACGFEAGRAAPESLLAHVDLSWIGALMHWDRSRTAAWLSRAREAWLAELGLSGEPASAYVLPRFLLEAELAPALRPREEIVLEGWSSPFLARADGPPSESPWNWTLGSSGPQVQPLVVLSELDDLFQVRIPRPGRPSRTALFAFQDDRLLRSGEPDGWEVLARAELWTPGLSAAQRQALELSLRERAEEWRAWCRSYEQARFERASLERWTRAIWAAWEQRFQSGLERELARLERLAGGELELAEGRLDRASERARFALRDHGGRRALVADSPAYELVHLLARRPHSYSGFEVQRSHERIQVPYVRSDAGSAPRKPLVPPLLGAVRAPLLRDLFQRSGLRREFEDLRRMGTRGAAEQARLEELARLVWRRDEQYGSDGLEGYFNPELAGRNGYREQRGLQEELEHGWRATDVPAVDGLALELTLDSALQLAALEVLERPRSDPDPGTVDAAWLASPTGALVLLSVEGDVLAMASYPDRPRGEALEPRDQPLERTLRLYGSQPPGSDMKPLVAAWALDRLGLDPAERRECSSAGQADGRAAYKTVHCHLRYGHGEVDLHEALRRSCNSYFAWLGDEHYDAAAYLEMYAAFGFGAPTGVHSFGPRSGLAEDGSRASTQPSAEALAPERPRMLACNGLGLPQTTVMQVARAYAGLATGRLPQVLLVRSVGGEPVARRGHELPLSRASLELVRAALWACANTPGGSAAQALSAGELGFAVAAKTGSADLQRSGDGDDERVIKHTWLSCYFPADRPRAVLVVFCERTRATAGHSSVWIAQQYLQHPEVRAWLSREGLLP